MRAPLRDGGCELTWGVLVERLHNNDVKYRFTLVDYDKQFQ